MMRPTVCSKTAVSEVDKSWSSHLLSSAILLKQSSDEDGLSAAQQIKHPNPSPPKALFGKPDVPASLVMGAAQLEGSKLHYTTDDAQTARLKQV